MSDQHLADQEKMWDMMEELRERRRAKNLGYTRWRTKNQGGMMNIDRMTAPLGYAAGGPAPKESGGLQPPTGLSKWYSDKFPVDPIHQLKENIIDKGKRAAKSIGRSISGLSDIGQELLGAGPAEATVSGMNPLVEFQEMYDQYIIDGGELSFRDFFDMIQSELDKMAGE